MNYSNDLIDQAKLVIARLERLSPDSSWARRSSGARGALLKYVEQSENASEDEFLQDPQRLGQLIHWGYRILEHAAKELTR